MAAFLFKRVLSSAVTLFIVISALFFLMRFLPGGPFDSERAIPPEIKANIERRFGLDKPLVEQYAVYMAGLVRGDLGPSLRNMGGRDVSDIIILSLPVSIKLGALALLFALILGVPLGVLAAKFKGGPLDTSAMIIAVSGISLPSYLLATFLIL